MRGTLVAVSLTLAWLLAACQSPEATRTRGGHGADVGNRSPVIVIHGGAEPYWHTPNIAVPISSSSQSSRR